MYARIVVPLDGSTFSEEVIARVAPMAEQIDARLTFVRIVERPGEMVGADAYVQALARTWAAEGRAIVSRGSISDAIMGEVDRVPGSLAAITARGRSGLGTAVLGSIAREYVQSSHDPVLVYRPEGGASAPTPRIATVLLPLDGTPRSESMQPQAAQWARALGARLVLVQVADASRFDTDIGEDAYVRARASDLARRDGIDAEWEVLHGDPVDALAGYLKGRRDVLVTMATRTQPALRAAVLGSVTSGLMHRVSAPVIVQAPRA
ncbi:universal stress protein [Microbacterium elymi]|uniref:Universal stress protein n=1 Tax=Microbacterium elymi TaxID=2909587 RepID=A0ABY5NHS9_9MICO|nr:universal stress protein [Microbacterium elymi]UUT34689.1 universal stress protein [Microbacterium elymi]